MNPKVSIIIPCYNHGHFIMEALDSVAKCGNKELYEVIIMDDGSTDANTIKVLDELSTNPDYRVIRQVNQGLGAARNNAIKEARGAYILPLDSDNRLRPAYLARGIEILDSQQDIAVVYGDAWRFGDQEGLFKVGPFNQSLIMVGNYIDACAMYRKSMWQTLGGYDEKMPVMGMEDWDFWMRASFNGFQLHYVPEVLYDYRVVGNSMIRSVDKPRFKSLYEYVFRKHAPEYYKHFRKYYLQHRYVYETKWYKRPFKIALRALGLFKPHIPPFFIYDDK